MSPLALRLNLGCSDRHRDSFICIDIAPPVCAVCDASGKGTYDRQVDLTFEWPWRDSSIEEIDACHIIEHLPDKILTMNELWRVLVPGGKAHIVVPSTRGAGAWCDPTHVSYWNANSFGYYEHGCPERERFRDSYGITADFRILSLEQTHYAARFGEEIWLVDVWLEAVKA